MRGAVIVLLGLLLMTGAAPGQAQPPVTLEVWDQFTEAQPSKGFDQIVAGYLKKYPNIHIRRNPVTGEQLQKIIGPALTSRQGPDILYYEVGSRLQELVRAGLVHDLSDSYERFGWKSRVTAGARDWVTVEGRSYGIPNELELDSFVFYRKSDFEQMGLREPRTWDEFLSILRAYKQAGRPGLMVANRGGAKAQRLWNVFSDSLAGLEAIDAVLFGEGTWKTQGFVDAASLVVQLFKEGYMIPNANAISRAEGRAIFVARRASLLFSGGWNIRRLYNEDARADDIDLCIIPPVKGGPMVPMLGVGSGFYIPSYVGGDKFAAALRFLDHLTSPEAAQLWVEQVGVIPAVPAEGRLATRPMIEKSMRIAMQPGRAIRNFTNLSPGDVNTAVRAAAEALIVERITPQGFVEEAEKAWAKAKGENRILRIKR